MRVSPRQGNPSIKFFPSTTRPITMHICGTTYRMEPNEALTVASQLADAVEGLRNAEAKFKYQPQQQEDDTDE